MQGSNAEFMTARRQDKKLGQIMPKLHLLDSHVVPVIRCVGVGLGLLAEQGSLSIHTKFNEIVRDHWPIRNPLDRLKPARTQNQLLSGTGK